MRTKTITKFANIDETQLIKLLKIFKNKYKIKINIQIKIYVKCMFTSIF